MRFFIKIGLLLLWTAASPGIARSADPPQAGGQEGPRSYVAVGPAGAVDLQRLQAALTKLPGVRKVEVRADESGITVSIDGDGASSQSILVATARNAGYRMRPAQPRFYRAVGPGGEEALVRLRQLLRELPGMEQLGLERLPGGAAVRVGGSVRHAAVVAAGKDAGFTLQVLTSYVASGPSAQADLERLRMVLEKVPGVEQVEMRGLAGGATLLVHGPASDERLTAAGKSAGYVVWPLGDVETEREFRLDGPTGSAAHARLTAVLKDLDGIGEIEIREGAEGARLAISGGRARPAAVLAAARQAGFTLTPVQKVILPSVEPRANRNTPPDYESRVLEDQARPGGPAPLFSLVAKDGVTPIRLTDLIGKRPVVLLFGSCT